MSFFNGKDEPENGFTIEDLKVDAARKLEILRAMTAEFIDENDDKPLAKKDICTATRTPLLYLKRSAALCEAAPQLPAPPRAAQKLIVTYAANKIYVPVFQEVERLRRQMRVAMWRKNLAAISIARLVHKLAGLLVETGVAEWLRTHVDQLRKIPGRPSRSAKKRD